MAMKADDYQMSKVFLGGGDVQYVLPIFQREYAWEQAEWQTLIDDVVDTYHASDDSRYEHFLGSLVVIEEDSKKTLFQSYTLVDGQQRLTSISLMLCALRDCLENANPLRKMIMKYLLNGDQDGDLRYKIMPTAKYDDRRAYLAILKGSSADGLRSRIGGAYSFFVTELGDLLAKSEFDAQSLFNCILSSFFVVFIELDRTDKPYKIFESLNHKGKALTEADLVRNYIAMRLPPSRQQQVFDDNWSKIEDMLSERRETARIPEVTAFLRHYLAFRSGDLPRQDKVYVSFRDWVDKPLQANDDRFVHEIQELHRFAIYYDKLLRPKSELHCSISNRLMRLNVLESTTAYPLLMHFYDIYDNGKIDAAEFIDVLEVIENYLVRRFLASEPSNYHNSMFTSLARELSRTGEQSAAALRASLGERNYPSDNRLRQRLMWNRLYSTGKSRRIVLILETINRSFGGDSKLDGPGTVEHIMPQTLSADWRTHLGETWQDTQRELLHTIGNLTIVTQKWNPKLSNKPFSCKREALCNHGIHLNSTYFDGKVTTWNADAIRARTNYLADRIINVWPAFAEQPRSEGVKGKTPLTLTVRDKRLAIYSWRGMALEMVNRLHDLQVLCDLERALPEFEWWITQDPGGSQKYYKQSSNGWWIQQNLSAEHSVYFCGRLAKFCDLSDDEWSFTYE